MEFLPFAEALQNYGVAALVSFLIWSGWKREGRCEKRAEANTQALIKLAESTARAIADMAGQIKRLKSECARDIQKD